jgi:putative photosynthetic complex assembly protein 2
MSFGDHALPLAYVALLWFASTGLVIILDHRARTRLALIVAGLFACGATIVIALTAASTDRYAAYASFTAAFMVWGWHELSFLTGRVTGPRRIALEPGAAGWTRFRQSAATVIHHEIALAATLIMLVALSWGQPNQAGACAFALLFALRLSTKFNIFAGVPNFSPDILPPNLAYLKSYFRRGRTTVLMIISVILVISSCLYLGSFALANTGAVAVTGSLLTALALLGLIEHLFLVLPVADSALWRWAKPAAAQV